MDFVVMIALSSRESGVQASTSLSIGRRARDQILKWHRKKKKKKFADEWLFSEELCFFSNPWELTTSFFRSYEKEFISNHTNWQLLNVFFMCHVKAHVLILMSKYVLLWLPTRRQTVSSYFCNGSVFLACLATVAVVDRAIKQCCCCQKTCITSCAPGDLSWNKTHETEHGGTHAAKGFMNTVQFFFFFFLVLMMEHGLYVRWLGGLV